MLPEGGCAQPGSRSLRSLATALTSRAEAYIKHDTVLLQFLHGALEKLGTIGFIRV